MAFNLSDALFFSCSFQNFLLSLTVSILSRVSLVVDLFLFLLEVSWNTNTAFPLEEIRGHLFHGLFNPQAKSLGQSSGAGYGDRNKHLSEWKPWFWSWVLGEGDTDSIKAKIENMESKGEPCGSRLELQILICKYHAHRHLYILTGSFVVFFWHSSVLEALLRQKSSYVVLIVVLIICG